MKNPAILISPKKKILKVKKKKKKINPDYLYLDFSKLLYYIFFVFIVKSFSLMIH